MKYPADIDKAMIPICDALNSLDEKRLKVVYSCEGHGRQPFYIVLKIAQDPIILTAIRKIFLSRIFHYDVRIMKFDDDSWIINVNSWNLGSQVFKITRKKEIERIVKRINQTQKELKSPKENTASFTSFARAER